MYFDLDGTDCICGVSPNWDQVAHSQNAQGYLAEMIIGNSVWPYVSGAGTQEFFAGIFAKLRADGDTLRLPYRCDAPMMKRYFVMQIARLPGDGLRISHQLIHDQSEDFAVIHLPEPAIEAVCSICLSVKRQNMWRDDYFSPRGDVPGDLFTVCETCVQSAVFLPGRGAVPTKKSAKNSRERKSP